MEEIEVNVAGAFDKGVKRGQPGAIESGDADALRNGRTAALVVVDDERTGQVMDQALHTRLTCMQAAPSAGGMQHLVVDQARWTSPVWKTH